ncbi:hypothetical protein [Sulfurimonas sp.]|jgi:hypothetical protein|uniref:hypothetical protein n=1 Tax=Sulfurimonas sp. TaxID=2022749 RepID=UPI0025ED50EF|nr:hypothetical protein [Sulfurimonas sp.]MBT5934102.1 hypothetical protein [Sulfurimonas sp.]
MNNQEKILILEKYLLSKEEIINKIDFVISKMILHEHEDVSDQIIENYLSI